VRCKEFFNALQAVEKSRCILPLPNLFPSLARRFACCQSCSVSLRTLWAYGFDSAAPRAPEKSKVGEKEKYFISFYTLRFTFNALLFTAFSFKVITVLKNLPFFSESF